MRRALISGARAGPRRAWRTRRTGDVPAGAQGVTLPAVPRVPAAPAVTPATLAPPGVDGPHPVPPVVAVPPVVVIPILTHAASEDLRHAHARSSREVVVAAEARYIAGADARVTRATREPLSGVRAVVEWPGHGLEGLSALAWRTGAKWAPVMTPTCPHTRVPVASGSLS